MEDRLGELLLKEVERRIIKEEIEYDDPSNKIESETEVVPSNIITLFLN